MIQRGTLSPCQCPETILNIPNTATFSLKWFLMSEIMFNCLDYYQHPAILISETCPSKGSLDHTLGTPARPMSAQIQA